MAQLNENSPQALWHSTNGFTTEAERHEELILLCSQFFTIKVFFVSLCLRDKSDSASLPRWYAWKASSATPKHAKAC